MRSFHALGTLLLGVAVAAFMGGCGSSSNDQGVTFTHLGYFAEAPCETGVTGLSLPISVIQGEGSGLENFGGAFSIAAVSAQNNLGGQTLRVRRVFYDYHIQGSSVQPPSTSAALSIVLGPGIDDVNSSLPESLQGLSNQGCAEVILVPNDILEWLNLNRNSLPELPFTLEVTSVLEGVTSAGDAYRSNDSTIWIVFEPDNVISPGSGGA